MDESEKLPADQVHVESSGGKSQIDAMRLEAMLELTRMTENTVQEISDFALNAAVAITESRIGYLAFTTEDETVLKMYAWSGQAMAECAVTDRTLFYPVETTGLWGEAVRQRRPVITNDYEAPNPLKRGTPAGHVRIVRHMNVPVFHGGRIAAVVGVGNKAGDYTEADARQLQLLTQEMWSLILRKRDQEKLREREELYRTLFENSTIGFLLITDAIIDCNEQTCRILGIPREKILGRTPLDFAPERQPDGRDSRTVMATAVTAALDERPQSLQWRCLHPDGRPHEAKISFKQITVGGLPLLLMTMEDITERVRAEEERLKMEAQLQQAQKLESLGVLAGGIAHDFNNLLMGVLGYADLAQLELGEEHPALPMLQEIERASKRAADLCRQMLAYAGRGKFVVGPLDLSVLVREMEQMLEISTLKKAALHYALEQGLPLIKADATQMRQIAMNLIVNAAEAIGERDGTITVHTGTMNCDREWLAEALLGEEVPEGRYVFLEISDTGCGMDAETMEKIFEPFFTTKFMGRGLGLAAVMGIVRGHKGAIKVASTPGRGTTIRIVLPTLGETEAAVLDPAAGPAGDAAERWGHGAAVLLADDHLAKDAGGKGEQ